MTSFFRPDISCCHVLEERTFMLQPAPMSLKTLRNFKFERILNEDPITHSLALLGTLPASDSADDAVQAVVRVEKTALNSNDAPRLFAEDGLIKRLQLEESTDIVSTCSAQMCCLTWCHSTLGCSVGLVMIGNATSRSTSSALQQKSISVKWAWILPSKSPH